MNISITIAITIAISIPIGTLVFIILKKKDKNIEVNNTGDLASPKLNQQNKKGGIKGNNNTQSIGDGNCIVQHAENVNLVNGQKKDCTQQSEVDFADTIKDKIKILFVDDKGEFPVVEHLRKIGYAVNCIKDIEDIDGDKVKRSHIIFLDINGVGKTLQIKNQGMGLCGALKDKYGKDKKVILYSGETKGDIFDKDAQKADATLPKDSDFIQFTTIISQYGKEILQKTN